MNNLFNTIIEMSISSSVLIIFVLITRFLLKKHSKSFSYYLWLLVFIKLILPFSFEVENSFVPKDVQDIVVVKVETTQEEKASFEEIINNQNREYNSNQLILNEETNIYNNFSNNTAENEIVTAVKKANTENYKEIIWISGVIALGLYFILSLVNINKSIKFAYKDRRNIYVCEEINIPFILGVFKPIIYLPELIDEKDKTYIVKHEKVHIKRLDYIIKPFCFLVLIIHWFNPLVWISFILMNKDMEMSCDEEVIKDLGSEYKKDYSKALLNFAIKENNYSMVAVLFGEKESESRIMNVLKYKKPQKILIGVFILAVAVLLFTFFTGEKEVDTENLAPVLNNEQTLENEMYNIDNVKWQNRSFVIGSSISYGSNNETEASLQDFSNQISFDDVDYHLDNLGMNLPREGYPAWYTVGTYNKENEYLSLANLPKDREESVVEFYSFSNLEIADKYEVDFSEIISGDTIERLVIYEKINDTTEFLVFGGSNSEKTYVLKAENKEWKLQHTFDESAPYATVRFINENVGIYGYVDTRDNLPNARMTYDGGITWTELDFSNLESDEKFSYGDIYNVYIDGSSIKLTLPFNFEMEFFSTDFGQTWQIGERTNFFYTSKYIVPIKAGEFTWSRGYTGKYPEHDGIDLSAELGTEILATSPGIIKTTGFSEQDGNYIIIDHGYGIESLYAHCSELLVKEGDEVMQGDVIAKVGATGNATGNHLHFEMITAEGAIDPLLFLPEDVLRINTDFETVWPTTDFRWSTGFVGQYPEYNGILLAVDKGTDVYAMKEGIVTKATNDEEGYGWHIEISHDDGITTLYAYCSELLVEIGQEVEKEEVIAKTGTNDYGYDVLHFEVIDSDSKTRERLDPLEYLPQ